MQLTLSDNIWISALMIFILRVIDMSLDTMRMLFVVRGKKPIAWILGFFQSLVFVIAISTVLANLNNLLNIVGYAAGFATGNVLGMFIEERLAIGHIAMRVISSKKGASHFSSIAEGWVCSDRDPGARKRWKSRASEQFDHAPGCQPIRGAGHEDRARSIYHRRGCPTDQSWVLAGINICQAVIK